MTAPATLPPLPEEYDLYKGSGDIRIHGPLNGDLAVFMHGWRSGWKFPDYYEAARGLFKAIRRGTELHRLNFPGLVPAPTQEPEPARSEAGYHPVTWRPKGTRILAICHGLSSCVGDILPDGEQFRWIARTILSSRESGHECPEGLEPTLDAAKAALVRKLVETETITRSNPASAGAGEVDENGAPAHVAVIGRDWQIFWAGACGISHVVNRHKLKIGDRLYKGNPDACSKGVLCTELVAAEMAVRAMRDENTRLTAEIERLKRPAEPAGGREWEGIAFLHPDGWLEMDYFGAKEWTTYGEIVTIDEWAKRWRPEAALLKVRVREVAAAEAQDHAQGDGVRTRDGRPARIICRDNEGPWPIVALIDGKAHHFKADGRYVGGGSDSIMDLMDSSGQPLGKEGA